MAFYNAIDVIGVTLSRWRLRAVLPLIKGREVVDLACGDNRLVKRLGFGKGIDISDRGAPDLVLPHFKALPFADSSIDTYTILAAFNYFDEPVETLKELARTLKPDGRILITQLHQGLSTAWHKLRDRDLPRVAYSEHEIQGIVDQAGLTMLGKRSFMLGLNTVFVVGRGSCEKGLSSSERRQREYYNRIADRYDAHYGSDAALAYRKQLLDRHLMGLNRDKSGDQRIELPGKRVLDACCGGGENSAYFVEKGAVITGLDISERQCQIYRQRFPDAEVFCASALQTGLPDESFDLVMTESLHHLHPSVRDGVHELFRLVKPGGHLILWEPAAGSWLDLLRKLWYRLDRSYFEDNEQSVDFDILRSQLPAGASIDYINYGGNIGFFLVMSSMHFRIPPPVVKWYAPLLTKIDTWVERLQTKRFSSWFFAVIRKS